MIAGPSNRRAVARHDPPPDRSEAAHDRARCSYCYRASRTVTKPASSAQARELLEQFQEMSMTMRGRDRYRRNLKR